MDSCVTWTCVLISCSSALAEMTCDQLLKQAERLTEVALYSRRSLTSRLETASRSFQARTTAACLKPLLNQTLHLGWRARIISRSLFVR